MSSRILIVDDEASILSSFASLLRDEGYRTESAESAEKAVKSLKSSDIDLILLDLQLPGQSGLEFLRELRENPLAPKVLVVSGHADIAAALDSVRLGAIDFLEKPVPPEKLIASVSAALALVTAERQRSLLVSELDDRCRIIGRSASVQGLLKAISQVAPTNTTVLITGKNGTGKELVATRLYLESKRREQPFLKVNCPGIPETLFESELFGHVKGAFTGAVRDHPGKFVQADGGTIFLDEIGDLPLACQAKLLRALETGEIETLGQEQSRQVSVRVICATNRDLENLVAERKFREDLFYRISVFVIKVPPLSARLDDVPLLAGEFLSRFDPAGGTRLSAAALAFLGTLSYPGNVRQLKNIIERLTILHPSRTVEIEDISEETSSSLLRMNDSLPKTASLSDQLSLFEKRLLEKTLQECSGNISEAARHLRVDRANLSRKIREMGLKTGDL